MTNYYIMITADAHKSLLNFPTAKQLSLNRLKNGYWPLYPRTKNFRRIESGDKLIIYAGGKREGGMSFIGTAQVDKVLDSRGRGTKLLIDSHFSHYTSDPARFLQISKCKVFKTGKSIGDLKSRLTFIKDKVSKKWGCYLQGGCLSISQKDYDTILK